MVKSIISPSKLDCSDDSSLTRLWYLRILIRVLLRMSQITRQHEQLKCINLSFRCMVKQSWRQRVRVLLSQQIVIHFDMDWNRLRGSNWVSLGPRLQIVLTWVKIEKLTDVKKLVAITQCVSTSTIILEGWQNYGAFLRSWNHHSSNTLPLLHLKSEVLLDFSIWLVLEEKVLFLIY